jgi:hypothetical protein
MCKCVWPLGKFLCDVCKALLPVTRYDRCVLPCQSSDNVLCDMCGMCDYHCSCLSTFISLTHAEALLEDKFASFIIDKRNRLQNHFSVNFDNWHEGCDPVNSIGHVIYCQCNACKGCL